MSSAVAVPALALLLAFAAGGSGNAASSGGAYTSAQAAAGAKAYAASCAPCHGTKLEGGMGPTLKGKSAPFHGSQNVGDVFTYVKSQMPMNKPGSLSPATYASIVAYLMQQNGHPAGAHALTPALAARSTVKM